MGVTANLFSKQTNRNMFKGLIAILAVLSVALLCTEAAPGVQINTEHPESRFFLLLFAKLRCNSVCAAVNYASTTSCTLVTSTLPCNIIFPYQAATAASAVITSGK